MVWVEEAGVGGGGRPSPAHSPGLQSHCSLWVTPWGFILGLVLVLPPHLLGGHWVLLPLFLWICQKAQEQLLAWQLWPPSPFPALEEGEWWGSG